MKATCLILGLSFLAVQDHAQGSSYVEKGPDFAGATHPFYAAKDVVFDKVLLGQWESVDSNPKERLQFEKRDGRSYLVIKETNTVGVLHLFKLKGKILIDLEDSGHLLFRVEQLKPTLKISNLRESRIGELLREKPFAVKRSFWSQSSSLFKNSSELLAAPSKVLRAFLLKHLDDPKLFENFEEYRPMATTTIMN